MTNDMMELQGLLEKSADGRREVLGMEIGAILLEQIDEWVVQRARYMPRDTLNEVLDQPVTDLPAVAH